MFKRLFLFDLKITMEVVATLSLLLFQLHVCRLPSLQTCIPRLVLA